MKLIDILAREMEEWPADYSATVWQIEDGRLIFPFGRSEEKYFTLASDWVTAVVTRGEWEKARREMWEGLDWVRVGIECEYSDSLGKWVTVEITAIAKHGVCFSEKGSDGECYVAKNPKKFRPLKSYRDRWIEQACEAVEIEAPEININIDCSYAIRKAIEVIYDAGLGKLKEEDD